MTSRTPTWPMPVVVAVDAVRSARVDLQGSVFDERDRLLGGILDGHDLVVVTLRDENRHVERLEVFGEVGFCGQRFFWTRTLEPG
jgi:hypothetical protein